MRKKFLSGKKNWFFLALYFSDVFMYFVSILAATLIFRIDYNDFFYSRIFLLGLLMLLLNYSSLKLYKDKRSLFDDEDFMKLLHSALVTFFVMIIFILMFDPGDIALITTVLVALLFTIVLTSAGRFVLYKTIFQFRKAGYDRKSVIFFGPVNRDLIDKVKENNSLGYKIIKVTNDIDTLKENLKKADVVFITKPTVDDKLLDMIIKHNNTNWKIVTSVLNLVIDPVSFDEFKDYPIINVSDSKAHSRYKIIKRIIDIILSGVSLVLLSPLFSLVVILQKMTMPGPVFFKHERLGKNLKPFMLYKFRSMVIDAEQQKDKLEKKNEVKGIWKIKDDPRITKFGKFLRRTCIDELPQLINIFKGDMSIVGPRPHLRRELKNFKGWRRARFRVKPGLTGMWQVNGRHELNFDKAVLYDIYYIKHMNLLMDIYIILKTIPAIIMTRGRY